MQSLPPVVAGHCRYRFPLCAASAGILAEVFLTPASERAADRWADRLGGDPSLAAWAWLQSRQADPPPASLLELALWLPEHARACFTAAGAALPAAPTPGADPASEAEAIAEDVLRSQLAYALASQGDPASADRARLHGLIARADRWMDEPAGGEPGPFGEAQCSPWLARASEVMAGSAPWPPGMEQAALRASAAAARVRWLDPGPPLAAFLPALAARLVDCERESADRLERAKIDALAEFAAGAGHEINNPLTVITGRAQLLLRDETDPERRHALALMHAQAMRVHEMIADMRLFARPPRLERKRFDLVALVRKTVEEMIPAATERSTELTCISSLESLEIDADPVQLAVALRALVRNALEGIAQAGHIQVDVRQQESPPADEVAIVVADDGSGIAPAQRTHVFEPFYSARQAGRGLGLGLSKCWQIARLHSGRIDIASQVGRGTQVTLAFPRS